MSDKHHKGQVFFKYLWQHSHYRARGNGVSPNLAKDIKTLALTQNWINDSLVLDNAKVFNWINGSVIPKWARWSGFILAVKYGWKPVDVEDVMSVVCLDPRRLEQQSVTDILDTFHHQNGLTFPKPIVERVTNMLEKRSD